MAKPIIAVSGSTSRQGWNVANTLLQSGRYHVKGLARKLDSDKAKRLAAKGAEMVYEDLRDKESLRKAFKGSHGFYAMTPASGDQFLMGKNQADAAHEEGVRHLVWSGLENAQEISMGEVRLPEFTDKAKAEDYMRRIPARNFKLTSVYLAFFYSNMIQYWRPKFQADGELLFKLPVQETTKLPYTDPVTSVGPVVLEIFNNPDLYSDDVIPIVNEEISPREMVEQFTAVTGVPADFRTAAREEFEDWEMLYFAEKYGYYRKERDLKQSRRINRNVVTWETFLKQTKWRGESWEEFVARNKDYACGDEVERIDVSQRGKPREASQAM